MKLGTIGAGRIAKAFVGHAAKAGYKVIMSNSRGADSLKELAASFGPNVEAGTVQEAAAADVVLLTIPWAEVAAVLGQLPGWNGRIILDTTNAATFPGFKPLDLGSKTSSELVQEWAKGARVVKAFNTLEAATLAADPHSNGGKRVVFISGDDAEAKTTVLGLIREFGFAGIDLGVLATGGKLQQVGGPLIAKNLTMA